MYFDDQWHLYNIGELIHKKYKKKDYYTYNFRKQEEEDFLCVKYNLKNV